MKRLILIFVSIFSIVFATQANTFQVNDPGDNGTGTLRQALADIAGLNTAVNPGNHTITFNAGMTITLNNSLLLNADPDYNGLTINGFVDGAAGPDVIIRSNNSCGIRGFDINGSITNLKFYGLVFQNVDYGIFFNANIQGTPNGSEIKGCYFGTDATGTSLVGTICRSGVELIGTSSVTIGGIGTSLPNGGASSSNNAERCIFGGTCWNNDNEMHGAVHLIQSNNVSIINCYIGVNAAGTTKLSIGDPAQKWARAKHGIYLTNSTGTLIDRNVISSAVGAGIYVDGGGNNTVIKGNIIGLDALGTAGYNVTTPANSFGNQATGIYLNKVSGCIIGYNGGTIANERNVIGANGGADHTYAGCDRAWDFTNQFGIYAEGITNCQIKGNYIGTDATGMNSGTATNILYNRAGGIKIIGSTGNSTGNTIGGTTANERNVISGHGFFWNKPTGNATNLCGQSNNLSYVTGGDGIILQHAGTTGNTVAGNYLGLASDGITPLGNFIAGIQLQGALNNTIGGLTTASRNYFCDNRFGMILQEDFTAHVGAAGNTILGNWIGLNTAGSAIGNGVNATSNTAGDGGGILIQMGSKNNKIGTIDIGNIISGNRSGIIIRNAEQNGTGPASANTIYNNIIGLDPTGATAIPNTSPTAGYGYGIQIEMGAAGTLFPFANIIGGTAPNQANTISSNQKSGVYINNATAIAVVGTANSIVGNKIGTTAAGTGDLGNTLQGIEIVNVSKTTITSNIISGNDQNGISLTGSTTNTISSNTVSSNSVNGIFLSSASTNSITNNTISTNTINGISVVAGSADNIIGGIAANEPNFIYTNGALGVLVDGNASINNSIHENSFSCNALRGIVLSNGGNQNIKTATILGSAAQLTYTNPNTFATRIEIFEVDACATCPADPTRLQGKTFIRSADIPASGTFVFTNALGFTSTKFYTAILHQGTNITTTAARNTSEFTVCYTLCSAPSPSITGTTTLCEGTTGAIFTVSPITTGSTYGWTVPTGVTITSGAATSSITVTIGTGITTANISVLETVVGGCSGSGNATLTIKAKPTSVSAGTTQNLCSATTVNLTGSTLPGTTTGAWTVLPSGPTFTAGTSASTTANGLVPGTNYTFTWAVTNAPCAAVTASSVVNNPIKPTPSITGITTLCEGTTGAAFSTTSVSGNTYAWTVPTKVTVATGAGTSSITATIGAAPITGDVTVTESSSATCKTTATATLTIKAIPTSVSAGIEQNLCSATTVNLTGSTHAGTTGAWSVLPSGPTFTAGTSASTTANGLVPGTNYTFTWAVTNAPCAAVVGTSVVNNPIKPTPSITGTTTLCEGTTSAAFSTTSVAGNTYTWTSPTGTTIVFGGGTSAIKVDIGTAPITGNVSVTESSSASCSTTADAALTIKAKPTGVSAGTDRTLCAATTVALTGSPLNGSTGAWTASPAIGITFDDATSPTTNANGLADATNYTFTWTVTNAPCADVTGTVLINNKPQPTVSNAGTNKATCNTGDVTLAGNTPTIGTGAWTVSPNLGITFDDATSPTAKASGLSTGTVYTFTWSITNSPCIASTSTVDVERTNLATPSIDGGGAHCSSLTATLTVNTANPGSTYVWDVLDGDATITSATTVNPITVNSGLSGGTIRVKESNGGCLNIEATTSITISPNNPPVVVGNGFTTCIGTAILVGNVPPSGTTGTWTVVPSTAVITATSTPGTAEASNLIDGPTPYTFTYTITGACGPDSKADVEVFAGLRGGFAVTADGPSDTLCVNTERDLSASITGTGGSGNYSYIWVSSDGSFSSTGNSANVTVKPTGEETTYTVYVLDNVNPGCKTNLDDVIVHAVESQDLDIPNLITPNGDNKNDIFILRDKVTKMDIISEGSHIEVVNRWGSKVYEANNYENNWVPKELTDGMYYYHITTTCGDKEYKSWLQILGNTNN